MRVSDFDYHLPPERIAQEPTRPRDRSRLLVLSRQIQHARFLDLPKFLVEGDLLILNRTKVIPAKLAGTKDTGGKISFLLIESDEQTWTAMIRGRVRPGVKGIVVGRRFEILERRGRYFTVAFHPPLSRHDLISIGEMPLPPYIKKHVCAADYQTVYAVEDGSIAAPTAGLHFTCRLLDHLRKAGISIVFITLHIGPGTFIPVSSEMVEDHVMEPERYSIPRDLFDRMRDAERVIAVGTSTVRALESAAIKGREKGNADVFIYPGYEFYSRIDALITNFHLPRSTNLMLVCAFGGTQRVLRAYEIAIRRRYRFYTFGDSMLVFRNRFQER